MELIEGHFPPGDGDNPYKSEPWPYRYNDDVLLYQAASGDYFRAQQMQHEPYTDVVLWALIAGKLG